MAPGVASKVIAASCGLSAFSIALLAGVAANNPAEVILGRALVCMVCVQLVGLLIGAIAERTVRDALDKYRAQRPIPEAKVRSGAPAMAPDDGVMSV